VNVPNQFASGENGNAAEQNFSVTPPAINLPKSGGAIRGITFPASASLFSMRCGHSIWGCWLHRLVTTTGDGQTFVLPRPPLGAQVN
jgi:hypothetical protein